MPAPLSDRIHRLLSLHNAMSLARSESGAGVETSRLLGVLDCERKALYAHAQELRDLGAPLAYSGEDHLWSYTETWNFPVGTRETIQGPAGTRLALRFLADPGLAADLRDRISPEPPHRKTDSVSLDHVSATVPSRTVAILARALRDRRVVRFRHVEPETGAKTIHELEPVEIIPWDGRLLLHGRDRHDPKQAFRRVPLDAIEQLEATDETSKAVAKNRIPAHLGMAPGPAFPARFRVDAKQANLARKRLWHPDQTLRELRDGSVEMSLPFGDPREAAIWLLGRGPGFKPTGPDAFVAAWKQVLQDIS